MTNPPINANMSKSKALVYLEYVLLGICLCVIALRVTFTEGPPMRSTTLAVNLGDSVYSLSVSAVLIFPFILWIVWSICSSSFRYRRSGIEIGLAVFCVATVVAGFAATDKRLAITDVAVFLAPVLMALLLVQILDSQQKIKVVLIVIAALGAVSAYQCAEQFFVSNQITIEQYEEDPQSMLEPLGIEPGTFPQFLFEHRLYSRGVRGFFTTRNSAGSFALMALFAAVALFAQKFRDRRSDPPSSPYVFACGAITVVILLSLLLTRSKGTFIGLFFAAAVFVAVHLHGNRLKTHKKAILVICLMLCIACVWAIASYGLKHGQLPGGGSMLVRWQYWHAAGKMYANAPLTGIGPGNFGHFYPHYKPAAALESVSDPHNFALSILTQYGPLGLAGFLAMIFVPLWRLISQNSCGSPVQNDGRHRPFRPLAVGCMIAVSAALLLIRPMLMDGVPGETFDVIMYVIVTVYVAPVAVFVIGFMLLAGPLRKDRQAPGQALHRNIALPLSCAVLAVFLHNVTDFAIFEPGVLTAFWAIIACIVAMDFQTAPRPEVIIISAPSWKMLAVASSLVISLAYLGYVLLPVASSVAKIQRANRAISAGQFEYAHQLLGQAAEADPLSATAPAFNGWLYLHRSGLVPGGDRDLLLAAAAHLKTATERNSASFKNFERLTDVYNSLAEISRGSERTDWLVQASEAGLDAIERYPGSGRVHFKLARITEQSDKTQVAIEHYRKAMEIEDAYRDQFRRMYPEREEVVSRLGKEKYAEAAKAIESLSEEPSP